MKTYQLERALAVVLLFGTQIALHQVGWVQMLGVLAVVLTFSHAQVCDRLTERQALVRRLEALWEVTGDRDPLRGARMVEGRKLAELGEVECWRLARWYWVAKEACWILYFLLTRTYPALVGAAVFIVYPLWRTWYRRWRPIEVAPALVTGACYKCGALEFDGKWERVCRAGQAHLWQRYRSGS